MLEKLDELRQLNEKFYEMYGRLYKNRKLLDNSKTVEFFGKQLFEQYKAEYEALKYKYEIEELPELETVKQRHSELVPRYRRPWYFLFLVRRPNRALKNIERAIYCEIEAHFRKKEAALERLEAALDKKDSAEQRTKIFDEPPEEPDEQTPTEPATEPKAQPSEKPDKLAAKAEKEKKPEPTGQAPGQITLDDVQAQTEPKKQ
ncbi:MAG: hypothetical protein K2K60_05010 [Clostridia bacterium]|nr:hypothetical protein [Clostridia bacterium]